MSLPPPPLSALDSHHLPQPTPSSSEPSLPHPSPAPPSSPLPFLAVDFDEGVLRTLCGLDCALPLLLDRLKQAVGTSREVSVFLKKRALLEEEYAAKLSKLSRERLDSYNHLGGDLKSGSFAKTFVNFLNTHERISLERNDFALKLHQVADQLINLSKEVERIRKINKDLGWRLEKSLSESEALTEKAKFKFDTTVDELEKVLMSKNGEQTGPPQGAQTKVLGKAISKFTTKAPRTPHQLARLEDEMRSKMSVVSDLYRAQVISTQQVRQEYFSLQLPRILRSLKEHSDEIDLAIQYYLTNYATLSESLLINEALSVSSIPYDTALSKSSTAPGVKAKPTAATFSPNSSATSSSRPFSGLKDLVSEIDNRADFKEYMANYAAHFNQTHHTQLHPNPNFYHQHQSHLTSAIPPHHRPAQPISSSASSPRRHNPRFQPPPPLSQSLQPSPGASIQPHLGPPSYASPRTSISSTGILHHPSSGVGPAADVHSRPILPLKKTFGVHLANQMMTEDGVVVDSVPKILEKSVQIIERCGGLDVVGIYRLSGTTSKIAKLKQRFDLDADNFDMEINEENLHEINDLTGVLKLWLRELPEPVLTYDLYRGFIEAGRIENDRLRHIRLHERVNELPDASYATLKYLMGHLDKVRRNEAVNSMGVTNLAVIFGPTLLSPPPMMPPTLFPMAATANISSSASPITNSNHPGGPQFSGTGTTNLSGGGHHLDTSHSTQSANTPPLGQSTQANTQSASQGVMVLQDMAIQCKVVETILEHYREIFIDEEEEEAGEAIEARRIIGPGPSSDGSDAASAPAAMRRSSSTTGGGENVGGGRDRQSRDGSSRARAGSTDCSAAARARAGSASRGDERSSECFQPLNAALIALNESSE